MRYIATTDVNMEAIHKWLVPYFQCDLYGGNYINFNTFTSAELKALAVHILTQGKNVWYIPNDEHVPTWTDIRYADALYSCIYKFPRNDRVALCNFFAALIECGHCQFSWRDVENRRDIIDALNKVKVTKDNFRTCCVVFSRWHTCDVSETPSLRRLYFEAWKNGWELVHIKREEIYLAGGLIERYDPNDMTMRSKITEFIANDEFPKDQDTLVELMRHEEFHEHILKYLDTLRSVSLFYYEVTQDMFLRIAASHNPRFHGVLLSRKK